MRRLIVIYDAHTGTAYRDAMAQHLVNLWECNLAEIPESNFIMHCVGTANVVHEVRVAIKQGRIKHTDVEFQLCERGVIKQTELFPDRDGRLKEWPEGFCDYHDKQLECLIDWD